MIDCRGNCVLIAASLVPERAFRARADFELRHLAKLGSALPKETAEKWWPQTIANRKKETARARQRR
jgi:hypothetical protein